MASLKSLEPESALCFLCCRKGESSLLLNPGFLFPRIILGIICRGLCTPSREQRRERSQGLGLHYSLLRWWVCLCFQQHHRPGAVCRFLPAPKRLDYWGDGGGGHFLPSEESWEHTGIPGARAFPRLPPRPPFLLLRIQLNALGNYWPQAQNSQGPVFSCQNQELSPFTCSLLNPTSRLPLGLPQLVTQAGKSTTRC